MAIARYNAGGSLDTTFDGDGIHTLAIGAADDAVNDVAVQADGKIVVAGHSDTGSDNDSVNENCNDSGTGADNCHLMAAAPTTTMAITSALPITVTETSPVPLQ